MISEKSFANARSHSRVRAQALCVAHAGPFSCAGGRLVGSLFGFHLYLPGDESPVNSLFWEAPERIFKDGGPHPLDDHPSS